MRLARVALVLVSLSSAANAAGAEPDPAAQPSAEDPASKHSAEDEAGRQADRIAQAQRAERELDPAEAARLYAEAVAIDPGARAARLARRRLAWLEERSEGGYAPLVILLELRSGELERARLDALAEQVRALPPGVVRREAWPIIGDAYLRHGEGVIALEAYEAWLESPELSEAERQIAHGKAALVRAEIFGIEASLEALERAELSHRAEATLLRAQRLGRRGTTISLLILAAFLALGLGLTRGRLRLRATLSPARIALAAWLFVVPLGLAWLYDRLLLPQLAMVVAALAAALGFSAVVSTGELSARARRGLAPLAAAAVIAAAFLAADRSRLLFDILWSIEQSRH